MQSDQMMRDIVFVTMGAPGGIGRFEEHAIEALALLAAKHQLRLHVLQLSSRSRSIGRQVYIYKANGSRKLLAQAFISTVLRYPTAKILFGHVNLGSLSTLTRLLRLRAHYSVAAYGDDIWYRITPNRRKALHRAEEVISISSHTTQQLVEVQGVAPSRIRLVPCSYRLESDQTAEVRASRSSPLLLSVTRLETGEKKGVDMVIRAMPRLLQRYPALRYEIIGDGSDRVRLQALAAELGVYDHIAFRGFQPDAVLREAYASCDIFVLPSGQEGFGIVYLEAMAAAKPVIAANAGGVPDVVVDGETGLLVPYDDVPALTGALSTLLDDPELRARFGAAGRDRLAQHFTFDQFVTRLSGWLELPASA